MIPMIFNIKRMGMQWIKFPILAGIMGGLLFTIVLHMANGEWHGLLEYNLRLSGIYSGTGMALILLCYMLTGTLSVITLEADGFTGKKILLSGILSGIIAGIVFSGSYLYTDIFLNPANYPPFPGDFLKLETFFTAVRIGWFVVVGLSMFIGMIAAAAGALASGFLQQRLGKTTGSEEDDVKNGNVNRTVLFAWFTLIIATLIIPPVIVAIGIEQGAITQESFGPVSFGSAGLPALPDQPIGDDHASNVTRWMQEHAGQEVSAGEYLEITNPGYLASHSQEVREGYYRMKIRVPNFSSPDPGEYDRSAGSMQYGKRSVAIAAFGYREIPGDQQPVSPTNYTSQCILNESMIEVSNGLADREIPAGTYFETVCPDFFFGLTESQKAALNNQSMNISKFTGRDETAAFVPPLYVPGTQIEFNMKSLNVVVFGIFGIAIVAVGYVILRRYRK